MKVSNGMSGILVFCLCAAGLGADENRASAPPRAAELDTLQRFVGEWDTQAHVKSAEGEFHLTGKVNLDWALARHFVRGKGSDTRPSEFLFLWTWDAPRKAYRTWFFNSYGADPDWSGQWNENSKTFEMANELDGGAKGTMTAHFENDNTIVWHADVKDTDGTVRFELDGKWTRHQQGRLGAGGE